MCTIAILVDVLVDAPVAIAANRDEFHARPARAPVALAPGVVGGKDELLGGSWLAFSSDGRFAAVTNQREPHAPRATRSRGAWVTGLLAAGDRAAMAAFVDALDPRAYASGNLVYGDASGVEVAYLRRDGSRARHALPPGITVLANDRVDAPGQPKQPRLRALLRGPAQAAAAARAPGDRAGPRELRGDRAGGAGRSRGAGRAAAAGARAAGAARGVGPAAGGVRPRRALRHALGDGGGAGARRDRRAGLGRRAALHHRVHRRPPAL